MTLWVAGAHQGRPAKTTDRAHEPLYDAAVLGWVDPAGGRSEVCLRHRSASDLCGGDAATVGHSFKGAALHGDGLWLCTERELVHVDRAGTPIESWSHPWLNDCHHVRVVEGDLHVAVSGLDAVCVVSPAREPSLCFLGGVDGAPPPGDLRAADLKPHALHPNFVARHGGELWVTCGATGQVMHLSSRHVVDVADVPIHDGISFADGLLFTAVDGRLIWVDPQTGRRRTLVDLRGPGEPLGWCRGVAVRDGVAWIGFSRLRATTLRRNLAWARGWLRGRQVATRRPTRLVGVELASGRICDELTLEAMGIDALYTVEVRSTAESVL